MNLVDRAQSAIRTAIVPLAAIAEHVPSGGTLYELGCGQGLLIAGVADRVERVVGVDYDPRKCRLARQELARFPNVEIVEADVVEWLASAPSKSARSVVLADTLSSLSVAAQDAVLRDAVRVLEDDGTLVLKIIDAEPRWKAFASTALSTLVYRVLRLSRSDRQRFRYRPRGEYRRLIEAAGLDVDEILLHRVRFHPIPHVVLVGRKAAS